MKRPDPLRPAESAETQDHRLLPLVGHLDARAERPATTTAVTRIQASRPVLQVDEERGPVVKTRTDSQIL